MNTVIGIDPGLRHTGWAIIDSKNNTINAISSGTINTSSDENDAVRLANLFQDIGEIIDHFMITDAGVERTVVNVNALSSLRLGQARGAILACLGIKGVRVGEYSPLEIKKSLVSGKASKDQLASMVSMLLPAAKPQNSDESDAYAIALMHTQQLQWKSSINRNALLSDKQ